LNDQADILSYSIVNQQSSVEINRSEHLINIIFPETVTTGGSRVAEFGLSDGALATVNGVAQVSGKTANNYDTPFNYRIKSEDLSTTIDWTVSASNNAFTQQWGLGLFQKTSKSNNRSYEWYIDQSTTGTYNTVNCGPTSTTMVAKWSKQSFSKTTEDARAAYKPEGGWWYTGEINNYLTDNIIPHSFINLSGTADGTYQIIKSVIDAGNIAILCLDMYYVRKETNTQNRIDKFYNTEGTGWGHFIVVKGYREVDDQKLLEVYDPNSYSNKYTDQTLKGKNRYYRSPDIYSATSIWWNYAIVVSPAGSVPKGDDKALDPSTVPQAWGR